MKNSKLLIYVVICMIFSSCERVKYFPDNPLPETGSLILAHKGGGFFDEGNTFAACKYGLQMLDGIECDIQKSKDNTLWLSHSSTILSCDNNSEYCFASTSDDKIDEINTCLDEDKAYVRLEEVVEFLSKNYPHKYISIDVKAWEPCEISNINMIKEMKIVGQKIIDLTDKYQLENRVMVESETGDFLYYVKTNCSYIETYLTAFGDYELGVARALHAGFSGVSFKYNSDEMITKDHIDLMHRKGLKIQLWSLVDTAEINKALLMNPDFIQTDNLKQVVGL
jgi:glycerophosphoryl diester phosphodiesterase